MTHLRTIDHIAMAPNIGSLEIPPVCTCTPTIKLDSRHDMTSVEIGHDPGCLRLHNLRKATELQDPEQ